MYCNELIINSYWCNVYGIPTSLWFIPSDTTHRFIKISKQHIEKQNLSNTEQSVEFIKFSNKLLDLRNLSINHLKKELTKYHSPIKNGSSSRER